MGYILSMNQLVSRVSSININGTVLGVFCYLPVLILERTLPEANIDPETLGLAPGPARCSQFWPQKCREPTLTPTNQLGLLRRKMAFPKIQPVMILRILGFHVTSCNIFSDITTNPIPPFLPFKFSSLQINAGSDILTVTTYINPTGYHVFCRRTHPNLQVALMSCGGIVPPHRNSTEKFKSHLRLPNSTLMTWKERDLQK